MEYAVGYVGHNEWVLACRERKLLETEIPPVLSRHLRTLASGQPESDV